MLDPLPEDARELAGWLTRLREKRKLSQKEAAHAIETSERSIRRWEREDVPDVPNGLALLKLLSAYGVHLTPAPPDSVPLAVNAELKALREVIISGRK